MMRLITILMTGLFLAPAFASPAEHQWRFRVWLDDKEIGTHEFVLQERDEHMVLNSEASFEYRLLFVKLYEYQHENREVWRDGCLAGLESKTDANGKPFEVRGSQEGDRFILEGSEGRAELPECVMSFAYWNRAFLEQERLINTQDGEWLEVEVTEPVQDELDVRGERRMAYRYRLRAGELDISLWYSGNDEWLALESEARGGRKLRYELL